MCVVLLVVPPPFKLITRWQSNRKTIIVTLPVRPQDEVIRMANHRTKWAQHGVDIADVVMVLVLNASSSMPVWSPIRLRDWAASVQSQPLVVSRAEIDVPHAIMGNFYQYACQGPCEYVLLAPTSPR